MYIQCICVLTSRQWLRYTALNMIRIMLLFSRQGGGLEYSVYTCAYLYNYYYTYLLIMWIDVTCERYTCSYDYAYITYTYVRTYIHNIINNFEKKGI